MDGAFTAIIAAPCRAVKDDTTTLDLSETKCYNKVEVKLMNILQTDAVITQVLLPAFYSKERGTPTPVNRESHGLVLNVDCWSIYRFHTGEILECHSGDCIYLPKGSGYTAERYPERRVETRGIYAVNFQISEEIAGTPLLMHVKGREELTALFDASVQAWRRRDVGFREECLANLYRIIRQLKREAAHGAPERRALARLAPALEYIKERYTEENISTAQLAALCGVSEPYLRRLFQDALSVSPAVYMRRLRLAYAKDLLASGEHSVTDAAMLSGFNDPAYFSREFKKEVGVSPREYEKRR